MNYNIKKTVDEGIYKAGESFIKSAETKSGQQLQEAALKVVSPKPTTKALEVREGRVIPEKKGSGKFKYDPTPFDKEMADTLIKVGFKAGEPLRRTRYNVQRANVDEAENLKSLLEANKAVFDRKEIDDYLVGAAKELKDMASLKGDPLKVALGFLKSARKIYSEHPSTLSGLLAARKEFDSLFKSQYGQMAFGTDRSTAAKMAAETIRSSLNDFIIKKAPDVKVADSLRKQFLLYKIEDNLIPKSALTKFTPLGRGFQKLSEVAKARAELITTGALVAGTTALGAASILATPAAILIAGLGLANLTKMLLQSPALKGVAGKALKALGKDGNLESLSAVDQRIIANEIKLLPPPEKAGGTLSAEKMADAENIKKLRKPAISMDDATKLAIKELEAENPLIFKTGFGKDSSRKGTINKRAFEIIQRMEKAKRKAGFGKVPSQDKTILK